MAIPKITIITVVRNGEKTLEQTMLSVLNQTYAHVEYIVVDGASTDGTLELITSYDGRIKNGEFPNVAFRWISEPDKGIYDAMNKGIGLATGDIVGIINADDWYEPGCFEKVAGVFESDPSTSIVYGKVKMVGKVSKVHAPPAKVSAAIFKSMIIPHPTTFVKSVLYRNERIFDVSFPIAADWELMAHFYSKGYIFSCCNSVIAHFRVTGASSNVSIRWIKERSKVRQRYLRCSPIPLMKDVLLYLIFTFRIKQPYGVC